MSKEKPTKSSSEQKNDENVETWIFSANHVVSLRQRNNNNNVGMISIQHCGEYTLNTNFSMQMISTPCLHIIGINPNLSDVPDSGTTDDEDSDYGYVEEGDLNSDNKDVSTPSGEQDKSSVDATDHDSGDINDAGDGSKTAINSNDTSSSEREKEKEKNSNLDTLTFKLKNPDGDDSSRTETVESESKNSVPLKKFKKF